MHSWHPLVLQVPKVFGVKSVYFKYYKLLQTLTPPNFNSSKL